MNFVEFPEFRCGRRLFIKSLLSSHQLKGGDLWKFSACRGSAVEGGHCKASPSEDFEFLKIELT